MLIKHVPSMNSTESDEEYWGQDDNEWANIGTGGSSAHQDVPYGPSQTSKGQVSASVGAGSPALFSSVPVIGRPSQKTTSSSGATGSSDIKVNPQVRAVARSSDSSIPRDRARATASRNAESAASSSRAVVSPFYEGDTESESESDSESGRSYSFSSISTRNVLSSPGILSPRSTVSSQPSVSPTSRVSARSPVALAARTQAIARALTDPAPATSKVSISRSVTSPAVSLPVLNSHLPPPPDSSPLRSHTPKYPALQRAPAMKAQEVVSSSPHIRDDPLPHPPVGLPCHSPRKLVSPSGLVFIAHDAKKQELMDNMSISWGTQYEIARGVNQGWWRWLDVTEARLRKLMGDNKASAKLVGNVLAGRSIFSDSSRNSLWAELDREQDAIIENRSRGLGLQGEFQGQKNWYGGRIQQVVRLIINKPDKNNMSAGTSTAGEEKYSLSLESMQMGRSHRFARYVGSRHIMQLKLPKDFWDADAMKEFCAQKFILCGRVFVPFSVKDKKLYLLEVNEDYEREPLTTQGDYLRLPLEEFIAWHNPMHLNNKQKVTKWTARFDLGLSTSVPILRFDPRNVHKIDDIYAPHEDGNAPAHKIFTDGCGYMNGAALATIGRNMGFTGRITAVQGRIFGAKGVWLLHPDDQVANDLDIPPRIWIRPSQLKVKLTSSSDFIPRELAELDPAHLIFDHVAPSRVTTPARLSRLTIINLAHNGVPAEVLIKLMDAGLRNEVSALTQWSGMTAMPLLWNAVNRATRVSSSRVQRAAAGIQRALGLAGRFEDEHEDEERDEEDEEGFGSTLGSSQEHVLDGRPLSLGESVLLRIQAGFSPLEDYHLFRDMKSIIQQTIVNFIKDYHIVIPSSAEAFIVPDPYGVLEEGQIHFRSSEFLMDPLECLDPNTVTGPVLIYRNPARLPSDVQKVQAVAHPKLAHYVNVIVLPIKGSQSLASLLAGGDVDGDTAICIFDQSIVQPFQTPETTTEPEEFLKRYFEPQDTVPSIAQVVEQIKGLKVSMPESADQTLRQYLVTGLSDAKVGMYSRFHEYTTYHRGYGHPSAIYCAFMFATVLDARKTGLVYKRTVYDHDKRAYNGDMPICLGGKKPGAKVDFVLERLLKAGNDIGEDLLQQYHEQGKDLDWDYRDPDLLAPFANAAKTQVPQLRAELEIIKRHIKPLGEKWSTGWQSSDDSPGRSGQDKEREKQRKAANSAKIQDLEREYARGPDPELVPELTLLNKVSSLKAAWAYTQKPKMAFTVAFQSLCRIKAETRGSLALTKEIGEYMTISSPAVRVLMQSTFEA